MLHTSTLTCLFIFDNEIGTQNWERWKLLCLRRDIHLIWLVDLQWNQLLSILMILYLITSIFIVKAFINFPVQFPYSSHYLITNEPIPASTQWQCTNRSYNRSMVKLVSVFEQRKQIADTIRWISANLSKVTKSVIHFNSCGFYVYSEFIYAKDDSSVKFTIMTSLSYCNVNMLKIIQRSSNFMQMMMLNWHAKKPTNNNKTQAYCRLVAICAQTMNIE